MSIGIGTYNLNRAFTEKQLKAEVRDIAREYLKPGLRQLEFGKNDFELWVNIKGVRSRVCYLFLGEGGKSVDTLTYAGRCDKIGALQCSINEGFAERYDGLMVFESDPYNGYVYNKSKAKLIKINLKRYGRNHRETTKSKSGKRQAGRRKNTRGKRSQ